MRCGICKHETSRDPAYIGEGSICRSCFNGMPDSVKENIRSFKAWQLSRLDRLMRRAEPEPMLRIGNAGIGRHTISMGYRKGRGFRLEDLKSISLNFHPQQCGRNPKTAEGIVTAVLQTKAPYFIMEEPLFRHMVTVTYHISGKQITYHYPRGIEELFCRLQQCIEEKSYDMLPYLEEYKAMAEAEAEVKRKAAEARRKAESEARRKAAEAMRKEEARRKAAEAMRKEEARRKAAEAMRKEEARRKATEARRKAESKAGREAKGKLEKLSPVEEAQVLFQVEMPYTKAELKGKRNSLMKKYHPDAGGSEEMSKRINATFGLLSQYAQA